MGDFHPDIRPSNMHIAHMSTHICWVGMDKLKSPKKHPMQQDLTTAKPAFRQPNLQFNARYTTVVIRAICRETKRRSGMKLKKM